MKENPCALNRQETFACVLAPSLKSKFGASGDHSQIFQFGQTI
jgi:hypothetical protein